MTRYLYAYFLEARPNEDMTVSHTANEILAALSESRLADDDGFKAMEFHVDDDGCVIGETNPGHGSVEQDDGFVDVVAGLAARFRDYVFVFFEENTENAAEACSTVFRNGVQAMKGYRRTLDPGELDQTTAKAIVNYLMLDGHREAAGVIATEFIKEP